MHTLSATDLSFPDLRYYTIAEFLSKLLEQICFEMSERNSVRFLPEESLVSSNSRGTTFPEHLQRPLALDSVLARWNFHTLEKPETKRSIQDFGGFGKRLRRDARRTTMSCDPRAHCAVSPFSFSCSTFSLSLSLFLFLHFCRQCEKRSWRDSVSIEMLRTLSILAFSCVPRFFLHLSFSLSF